MLQPIWRFYLAQSSNLNKVAEITHEARNKSFSLGVNRPGSLSFDLPFSTIGAAYLNPLEYCVIATKNKQTVWSGPIWTREDNFDSAKFSVGAVGWFELLKRRYFIDDDHQFNGVTDGAIAFSILSYANSQVIAGSARPTWITGGTNTSTTERIITFDRWNNVGDAITQLTEIEAGFDFEIDPVTRAMNIFAWDDYTDNENAIFGFNFGPNNAKGVSRKLSADDLSNDFYVIGKTQTAHANAVDANIDTYNLHQKVINLNEVGELGVLASIANVELTVSQEPRITIDFTSLPPTAIENVPSFFEDYNLRDKVYLTAKREGVEIENQAVRIFSIDFSIDANDNEIINSLGTTYQSG